MKQPFLDVRQQVAWDSEQWKGKHIRSVPQLPQLSACKEFLGLGTGRGNPARAC